MQSRAVQFMPFDALKGFKEALAKVEKVVDLKKELMDDYFNELDNKLKSLKKGDTILVKYYYDFEYAEVIDSIKIIDEVKRKIVFKNCVVSFDDIIDFEKITGI